LNADGRLKEFNLDKGRDHRYLRIPDSRKENKKLQYCLDDYKGNIEKFHALTGYMKFLDFSESDIDDITKILAAVLLMGDIRFAGSDKNPMHAVLDNPRTVERVAKLLQVESKKFAWALVNYCLVKDGQAILCHHTPDAARDARDTLAATTYSRLVDYIVNRINQKLAVGRAL
jgi:myosin heavy subunit